tara:strand:+ start:237 stop:878 length:642 start_codon:yes stop_codon:yes gene_type:complete
MGSTKRPSASDYAASEEEKALASVSLADKNFFRESYLPKLTELRDQSMQQDYQGVAKGRAQADTMQALSGKPSLLASQSVDAAADLASAASSMQLAGGAQGLAGQRQDQINVLKNARGLSATATSGLSQAARIGMTDTLAKAGRKQARRMARLKNIGRLTMAGIENIQRNKGASDVNKKTGEMEEGNMYEVNTGISSFFRPPTYQGQYKATGD